MCVSLPVSLSSLSLHYHMCVCFPPCISLLSLSPLSYVCVFPSPYLSPLSLSITICVCVSLPVSLSSLSLHYHHTLAGLTTVSHSVNFENCSTTVLCYSPEDEGKCSIRYGLDSYNQDPTISGSLNTKFTLPLMKPNTLYHYQINVTSNYTVQFQGNFTTGECELINFYLNTTPVGSRVVSCLSVCSYFTTGECELINFYL